MSLITADDVTRPSSRPSSDVAFTPSVKAAQQERGSRSAYRRMEEAGSWETRFTPDLVAFLRERDSFYLATANLEGQPYIQHRGGPKGFLRVIDDNTLGFVDFAGNKQFITLGNLADNQRAFIFLMDYESRRRVKLWGNARVVEGDNALMASLMPLGTRGRAERVILFDLAAWDVNCPQHIPRKVDAAQAQAAVDELTSTVEALKAENQALRLQLEAAR